MSSERVDLKVGGHVPGRLGPGRRGVLVSLLIGIGSVAIGWVSWLWSSAMDRREFHVVARWRIPGGGKGLIITIGPDPTDEELRALGERLKEELGYLDDGVVMIFDDAEAARLVRRGSRRIGEEKFRRAALHQRAMYLRSSARDVHSFTIYDRYPEPREVINYEQPALGKPAK